MALEAENMTARGGRPASGWARPFLAVFQASLRALLTGRRWIVVAVLDVVFVALALILSVQSAGEVHAQYTVDLFRNLGLPALIPFVALLFATEALGAEIEDRTLIYLTLRPLSSYAIVLAKFAAVVAITIAATWLALLVSLVMLASGGVPASLLPALLMGATFGSIAYCGLFLLLGLLLRRALIIGAMYVLIWEAAFAGLSILAAHLSVRYYTLGVFADTLHRDDLLLGETWPGGGAAAVGLLIVTALALAWTARRLRRLELK